jgi:hypothetical protein
MNNMKKRIFSVLPLALPVALSAADAPPGRQGNLTV